VGICKENEEKNKRELEGNFRKVKRQKRDNAIVGGKKFRKNREGKFSLITIPRYEWVSAMVNSYPTQFQTHDLIERFKRGIDMTIFDDVELLIVEPNNVEEGIFMRVSNGEADFVYMYEDVFKEMDVQFPFLDFECEILSLMNVASVQLHPNIWAFLHAFQILCKSLKIETIVNKFMYFYQLKIGVKVR